MEEKNETQKLTYEQLEGAAAQLQHRCMELENRLRSIDLSAMRLNYLFEVLKSKDVFPAEFIENCAKDIMEMLTPPAQPAIEEAPEETKEE